MNSKTKTYSKFVAFFFAMMMVVALLAPQAMAEGSPITVVYDAQDGTFADGSTQNSVTYDVTLHEPVTRYCHTSNINDEGVREGAYGEGSKGFVNEVITIPEASSLHVAITYGTNVNDKLYICEGEYRSSYGAPTKYIGKLAGGSSTDKQTVEYTIKGNTVSFYFYPNWGNKNNYYGFYAVIEDSGVVAETTGGTYLEPTPNNPDAGFIGWNTLPDGSGETVRPENVSSSMTAYAQYRDSVASGDWWHITGAGELVIGNGGEVTTPNGDWPWTRYANDITSARMDGVVHTTGSRQPAGMFQDLPRLKSVDLHGLDVSQSYNPNGMFREDTSLEYVDLSCLDSSTITTTNGMFYGCSSLKAVNMDGLNTSKVYNMTLMFYKCTALESIDLSMLDISALTEASQMLQGCTNLKSVGFFRGTPKGQNTYTINSMLRDCTSLETVDVSEFNPENIYGLSAVFQGCTSLKTIDLSSWNVQNVKYFRSLFEKCTALESVDLSSWNVASAEELDSMFYGCSNLKSVNFSGWNTPNLKNIDYMFGGCSALTSLDLSSFNTSKLMSYSGNGRLYSVFSGCSNLETLNISSFNTSTITEFRTLFTNCNKLSRVILGPELRTKGNGITDVSKQFILPTPPEDSTTGKWIREDGIAGPFTPEELRDQWDDHAGEWAGVWIWEIDDSHARIAFDGNGGQCYASTIIVDENPATITLPSFNSAQRPGFGLAGWNTAADGTGTTYLPGALASVDVLMGQTTTLYAQWEEGNFTFYSIKHYQQSADFQGYNMAAKDVVRGEPGETATAQTKTYEGFITPEPLQVVIAADGTSVVEYYYDREYYYVNFEGNGADYGHMDPAKLPRNISTPLPKFDFIKNASYFAGWNTEPDGSGDSYANEEGVLNLAPHEGEITLYAQWLSIDEAETVTNGELTVHGKAGEKIIIPGIPAGTTYTVNEINLPNGWTQTSSENNSNTVFANGTQTVHITNSYSAEGTVTILAHKLLNGGTLAAGQFSFVLKDSEGNSVSAETNTAADRNQTLPGEDGIDVENPWFGTGLVRFDDLTFDTEGTYTYTIEEVNGGVENIIYDSHVETVTVVVTDNGDGTMKTEVSYDADGALFTNEVRPSLGSLTVRKAIENASALASEQQFTFTVHLMDETGNSLGGSYILSLNGTETGMISDGGTVTIPGGASFSITGLPVNARYSIEENPEEGWELISARGGNGSVVADTDVDAVFTNAYSSTGSVQLTARKELSGMDMMENYFQFELKDAGGNLLSTAYAAADGSIEFQPIDYTLLDDGKDFYYYITEIVPEVNDGITYDTTSKEVLVHVADDGHGHMNATVTEDPNGMVFRNAKSGTLTVSKEVRGNGGNKAEYFTFTLTLTNADGSAFTGAIEAPENARDWTEEGSGVFTFKLKDAQSITLSVPFGVTYNVTEANENYRTSVKITQNGSNVRNVASGPAAQGTLDYTNGDYTVVFTNSLTMVVPTGVNVTPFVGAGLIAAAVIFAVLFMKKRKTSKA